MARAPNKTKRESSVRQYNAKTRAKAAEDELLARVHVGRFNVSTKSENRSTTAYGDVITQFFCSGKRKLIEDLQAFIHVVEMSEDDLDGVAHVVILRGRQTGAA